MARFRRWLPWIAVVVIILGFINFFWFMAESTSIGGDALNGHISNGRYYVASHGTYTEVSEAVWNASRMHAISMLASWPFVMLSLAFLTFRYRSFWREGQKPSATRPTEVRWGAPAPTPGAVWTPSAAEPVAPEAVDGVVPGPMRVMSVFGLVMGLVMVVVGVAVVVPGAGMFGIVWTGFAVVILAVNTRRFIRRGW